MIFTTGKFYEELRTEEKYIYIDITGKDITFYEFVPGISEFESKFHNICDLELRYLRLNSTISGTLTKGNIQKFFFFHPDESSYVPGTILSTCTFILIDSATGQVKAQRIVSLNTEFANRLKDEMMATYYEPSPVSIPDCTIQELHHLCKNRISFPRRR